MTNMAYIGDLQPVADGTMAANVRQPGSETQQAIDERIQPVAAEIIASDPTVTAGATVAVDRIVDEKDLLQSSDLRVPQVQELEEEVIHAHASSLGERTHLEARGSDGGPTEWAELLWRERLHLLLKAAPGYSLIHADPNGLMSDLAIRDTDGQIADWVMQRWAARIAAINGAGAATSYADVPYTPGAAVLPVHATKDALVGWGSSTLQFITAKLTAAAATVGMTYHGSGGRGGTRIDTIAAWANARPLLLTFPGNSVPASGSVVVAVTNARPNTSLGTLYVTVAGIAGKITSSTSASTFTFERTTAGSALAVPAQVPAVSSYGLTHRNDVTLIQAGKNDFGTTGADATVIDLTRTMFNYQAALNKNALVIGHFADGGTPASSTERTQIRAVNASYAATYGAAYLDVYDWVTSAALWSDPIFVASGLTPTSEDYAQQALGNKPPSISADAGHFNDLGHEMLAARIIAKLVSLRWTKN